MCSSDIKPFERKNGFQRPWHLLQILTWMIYPCLLLHYYVFLMTLLWDNIGVRVAITLFFSLCSVIALVAAYITCDINPADDAVLNKKAEYSEPGRVFCYLCETHVHSTSKHCKYCDKCVLNFDHHCKWLNTCVGNKNYRFFLLLIVAVGGITTLSLTLSLIYFVELFLYPTSFLLRVDRASVWLSRDLVLGVLVVSLLVLLGLVAMVFQLLGFHAMLAYRGMTTYDFIVFEQRRQRERAAEKLVQRDKNKGTAGAADSKTLTSAPKPMESPRERDRGEGEREEPLSPRIDLLVDRRGPDIRSDDEEGNMGGYGLQLASTHK